MGVTSVEIAFLGKMPTRKIFTRRNDHSKNMHREKYILEKKPDLLFKIPTEMYPECDKYSLGKYAWENYISSSGKWP